MKKSSELAIIKDISALLQNLDGGYVCLLNQVKDIQEAAKRGEAIGPELEILTHLLRDASGVVRDASGMVEDIRGALVEEIKNTK